MSHRYLIFEKDVASYHCQVVAEGVRDYLQRSSHDLIFLPLNLLDAVSMGLCDVERGLGVIGCLTREDSVRAIRARGIPLLNLGGSAEELGERLRIDFAGEGATAAAFFIDEMRFDSLAFIGTEGHPGHQRRHREFAAFAAQKCRGVEPVYLRSKRVDGLGDAVMAYNFQRTQERRQIFENLLERSSKPLGIFCGNDRLAGQLFHVARRLGVRVPEELSILGVGARVRGREEAVAEVSVVLLDHYKLGMEAARLMESFLFDEVPGIQGAGIAPLGTVHRETTSRRAVGDALVRDALALIQADRGLSVAQLCRELKTSRYRLEQRFAQATRLSVVKAIEYERFSEAKNLLRTTHYGHEAIAGLAGYSSGRQMHRAFVRYLGESPTQYRRVQARPVPLTP